ncbi:hypothetical protein V1514DRAFT_328414 [Lipomyces japonicus]|uniref:uncharacterized protein n=1 Tax=Lipomyces japonicus TaxID=56871 RepID=UPI0034D02143
MAFLVFDFFFWSQIELLKQVFTFQISFTEFYFQSYSFTTIYFFLPFFSFIVFLSCNIGRKNNFTLVDKLWSIITFASSVNLIVHDYLVYESISRKEIYLLALLAIWAWHLTVEYIRRGGLEPGHEDHRWPGVKSGKSNIQLFFFGIAFVAIWEPLMLVNITQPVSIILESRDKDAGVSDIFFLFAIAFFIYLERVFDDVQQNYQNAKRKYESLGEVTDEYTQDELERGFCTQGPFGFSRHPNFAAEQYIWLSLYLWGAYSSGRLINWSAIGTFSFLGFVYISAVHTEAHSSLKYPQYKLYQQSVAMLLPLPGYAWIEPVITKSKNQ